MGREVVLPNVPQRIISLVPSQTELLYDLGLGDRVVGITKFCIYPEIWYRSKTRVGGTKSVDIDMVRKLQPDLIIGNKEENDQSDIELLEKMAPVWMSDVYNLEDAITMLGEVGVITDTSDKASQIVEIIQERFDALRNPNQSGKHVAYFIWYNPDMVAGKQTFIDDMIARCGWKNAFDTNRYPVDAEPDHAPDFVFLSSEPYPFREKHVERMQSKFPNANVVLVDGEYFSWYGSRLLNAPDYFESLIAELS